MSRLEQFGKVAALQHVPATGPNLSDYQETNVRWCLENSPYYPARNVFHGDVIESTPPSLGEIHVCNFLELLEAEKFSRSYPYKSKVKILRTTEQLIDQDGQVYRFSSCRWFVSADPTTPNLDCGIDDFWSKAVGNWHETAGDVGALLVLCDYLDDKSHPRAEEFRQGVEGVREKLKNRNIELGGKTYSKEVRNRRRRVFREFFRKCRVWFPDSQAPSWL